LFGETTVALIDRNQFDFLYRQNYPRIRHFVVRQGFCDDIAEDIVQESFVNAWEKRSSLSSIETFGAWVRAISRNLCYLHLRSRRLVPMNLQTNPCDSFESSELGDREEFASWLSQQCDETWNHHEREAALAALQNLVQSMPEGTRGKVGRLFYFEQKSVNQISDLLNIKQNTILSHLRRFRLDLTRAMGPIYADA
jgi:RNA polymerase sigma-70 factor (ECF subfamily)